MKVKKVIKENKKYHQYDISTSTENFYILLDSCACLIHNSPAIFAGIDPSDGKFFVAKKGIFNKNPQIYKTAADVKKYLSGDLQKKFLIALAELPKVGIKSGVYQGDMMFTKGDVKKVSIEGEKYYTFHPNTIVYAVPMSSELGRSISRANIGIVWHTTYTGRSLETMSASFGKSIVNNLKHVPSVWQQDAMYQDYSGQATFTIEETSEVTSYLAAAGKIFNRIPAGLFQAFVDNEELRIRTLTFNNSKIRSSEDINPAIHARGLFNYLNDWYDDQIKSKKTEKGKEVWKAKKVESMKIFSEYGKPAIENLYKLMYYIVMAKRIIIDKMNSAGHIKTFLRTSNGFRITNPEGFVAIDHLTGGAVKLVNRMEFSKANFSSEVLKGWSK